MKYKIGDKVKIRSWESLKTEYGLNGGNIKAAISFVPQMKKWCNKVVTIERVNSDHYILKENNWAWVDEIINHPATKIENIIYRLEMLKNLTTDISVKNNINGLIPILRSDHPYFDKQNIIYYNDIFRKIKGKK